MLNKLSYSQQAEILFHVNVHRKLKLPSDRLKAKKHLHFELDQGSKPTGLNYLQNGIL